MATYGRWTRTELLGYRFIIVMLVGLISQTLSPHIGVAAEPPLVEEYLQSGKLSEGHDALTAHLKDHPDDQQARFGLGVIEFLQSIEHLAQSHYKYGLLRDVSRNVPLLRLPVPPNANPETLSYDGLREVLQDFIDDLAAAEKTLTGIGDAPVKLPLHFGLIRLDLDGDGEASDGESLWQIYAAISPGTVREVSAEDAKKFVIQFDTGDVYWLRGYCHLLMFLSEGALAYDGHELFERTGHLLWPKTETPYDFLRNGMKVFEFSGNDVADVIAFIHLMNFPVMEPKRMTAAHGHLKAMTDLSRLSWKAILAEKDDEAEWVPNPKQTGVIPGVRVTKEMVDGWHLFLSEMDQILDGKKLIPFWRGSGEQGINFKKVFTDPSDFDLVLWIQGTAAAPYLEEGEITSPDVWGRLMQVFQGQFIGFAIWFN